MSAVSFLIIRKPQVPRLEGRCDEALHHLSFRARVANGLADVILTSHRELLVSMGLIAVTPQGSLVLTPEGRTRLAALTAGQPPIKGTQPPAD